MNKVIVSIPGVDLCYNFRYLTNARRPVVEEQKKRTTLIDIKKELAEWANKKIDSIDLKNDIEEDKEYLEKLFSGIDTDIYYNKLFTKDL